VTRVQVLYWENIPSLVKATGDDGSEVKRQLPDWFQQEIDRVAMDEGVLGADEYLERWRWSDPQDHPGSPGEAAEAVEAELLAAHDVARRTPEST
jgi:hypothetical protein